MKMFVIEQLPVIAPDDLLSTPSWAGSQLKGWLVDRAFELYFTTTDLQTLAVDLGRDHPPFRWDPERRFLLQAEIDAAILHAYRLNRLQAEWLIDSFNVLRKYEERDDGEFRTKRVVLEIFDEMEAAKRAGAFYQTRLNPGPADPKCCHLAHVPISRD